MALDSAKANLTNVYFHRDQKGLMFTAHEDGWYALTRAIRHFVHVIQTVVMIAGADSLSVARLQSRGVDQDRHVVSSADLC